MELGPLAWEAIDTVKLQFLGAAGQVTGSQYLLHVDGVKVLVDCGMYQERAYLDRNWEPSVFPPKQIDAILLTHAHIDHCGLLPKLVREGFRGPIYTTPASADLVAVVLHDAAKIQTEDAAFKRKRHRKEGRRGRFPVKPLFTEQDVNRVLPMIQRVDYRQEVAIKRSVIATLHDAGHILGSAMLDITVAEDSQPRRLVFSGDLGQSDKPIIEDPAVFTQADYVVMESTYGDRQHDEHEDIAEHLARVICQTVQRGGNVVIPTFAIERTQEVLYHLSALRGDGRIPETPIFLDSPMATAVTEIFRRHRNLFDADAWQRIAAGDKLLRFPGLEMVTSTEDSKAINDLTTPAIIMATSGMCTAGRIKHHLVHNIMRPECTVLFVGYQAAGTLGRQILDGNPEVRIHGRRWPVRANVEQIQGFSGHADGPALLRWLGHFETPPRQIFLTHGEREAAEKLAAEIRGHDGWTVTVPKYRQCVTLT